MDDVFGSLHVLCSYCICTVGYIWNICILHDRSFANKRILHGSRKLLLETYLLVTYSRSITYLMVGPHVLANSSQFSYTPHKINERGNVRKGY